MYNLLLDSPSCFCSTEYWESVIQNAIGCLIGSGLAIFVSYKIYKWTIKKDENNRIITENKRQENVIKYFKVTVKFAIQIIKAQQNNIVDLVEKIKKDEINFHLMVFVPLNNLQRIISNNSLDVTLLVYANKFSHKENPIKEFQEILAGFDYFYSVFNQLQEQLGRVQKINLEGKTELKNIFKDATHIINEFMLSKMPVDVSILAELDKIIVAFHVNHSDTLDLQYYHNSFFVPLNEFTLKCVNEGNSIPFIIILRGIVSDGISAFNQIKFQNRLFVDSLEENMKISNATLEKLENSSKNLISS